MKYLEFVKNNVRKILEEIEKVEIQLENFPKAEKFNYSDYGTRDELLKEYNSVKKKRFKFFIRVKDSDLNEFVYRRERQRLVDYMIQLEEKLAQLMEVTRKFDGVKFTREIFPNNFIVQSILEYHGSEHADTTEVLYILISLFKKISLSRSEFAAVVERNIADNFGDELQLCEGISLKSLLFMLDKALKMLCPSDFLDYYVTCVSGLKYEISLQYRIKETGQKREDLEKKKKAISELNQYINGEKVIKVAPSLDTFKELLSDAGVVGVLQEKYVSLMNELIFAEEQKEAKRLVEKYLGVNELAVWNEALAYSNTLEEEELAKFLSRVLKDIVSLCKYMESVEIPNETQTSYDTIDEKIQVIKTILRERKEKVNGNSAFYYLTDDNNVPCILNNIEGIDSFQYDEIFRILRRISNGEDGVETRFIDDISFRYMEGNNSKVLYCKKDEIVVILEAVANNIYSNKVLDLPDGILAEVKRIFENAMDPELKRNQEIFEKILLQKLDLNYLGGTETGYSLKKVK